ncbi:MAG: hypothetical protein R3B72_39115 [Polyangiaceae bacterium]
MFKAALVTAMMLVATVALAGGPWKPGVGGSKGKWTGFAVNEGDPLVKNDDVYCNASGTYGTRKEARKAAKKLAQELNDGGACPNEG